MMILLQGNWSLFIGRFHPLLVHLPIGMLIVAFILEVMSRNRRLAVLGAAVLPVLVFGALSAVAACIAGWLLSASGGYDEEALDMHMWMGIGVAVISVLLCIFRRYALFRKAWLPVSFVMIVLLSFAGHFGGNLTHGEDYLTAEFPLGKKQSVAAASITNLPETKVYEQLVAPILEQKCYSCHNEAKLKGGLRLDGMENIRKGGENGPVIKDSLPEASELYKRLILSESDDKRMPPKGKPQLTPQQLEILYWWIETGASPTATVKELHRTPRMELVLDGLKPSGAGEHPFMPQDETGEASAEDIAALERIGVKVMPVADESGFVMINAVNAPGFSNKDAALLLPLKKQIVWLRLSDTQAGDSALKIISGLPGLMRLHLENTPVTDAGLAHLAGCKQLKYLNLVGTKVTDKGILQLQKNKALKELFLYKTAVTPAGLGQLRKALPEMAVDTGGYRMPVLVTDTLVYRKQRT